MISGNDITLPPESSSEETEQPLLNPASAAPSLVGVSDPEADMEVHRLINEQRFQDAAREALHLAVMGRRAGHAPTFSLFWGPPFLRRTFPYLDALPRVLKRSACAQGSLVKYC